MIRKHYHLNHQQSKLILELAVSPRQTWNHGHSLFHNQNKSYHLMARTCESNWDILSSCNSMMIIIKGRKNSRISETLPAILTSILKSHRITTLQSGTKDLIAEHMQSWESFVFTVFSLSSCKSKQHVQFFKEDPNSAMPTYSVLNFFKSNLNYFRLVSLFD